MPPPGSRSRDTRAQVSPPLADGKNSPPRVGGIIHGHRAAHSSSRQGTRVEWDEIARLHGEKALEAKVGAFGPGFRLFGAAGCGACGGTGYRGSMPLHELLVTDDRVKALMARRAPTEEIRSAAAQGGLTTLLEDGIDKMLAGDLDARQVLAAAR